MFKVIINNYLLCLQLYGLIKLDDIILSVLLAVINETDTGAEMDHVLAK